MKILYKLTYEIVNINACPQYYKNDRPIIAAPEVPAHCWEFVEVEYTDYKKLIEKRDLLKRLITQNSLIRNVQIFKAEITEWTRIS